MSDNVEYMKALIKRAEELVQSEKPEPKPEQVKEPKPKQKRHYSDAQKEAMTERLRLAREKSKQVREIKKDIKEVIKNDEIEEYKEKAKKFVDKSIDGKMEKLQEIKQKRTYNPPKQEIQAPIKPKPEPVVVPTVPAQPAQPAQPPPPPQPQRPKYFLPKMSYAKKHNFLNPL